MLNSSKNIFLFIDLKTLRIIIESYCLIQNTNLSTLISGRVNFVCHHWECTSMYRLLCYPSTCRQFTTSLLLLFRYTYMNREASYFFNIRVTIHIICMLIWKRNKFDFFNYPKYLPESLKHPIYTMSGTEIQQINSIQNWWKVGYFVGVNLG